MNNASPQYFTPDQRTQERPGYGYAVEHWCDSRGVRFEASTLEEAMEMYRKAVEIENPSDTPVMVSAH